MKIFLVFLAGYTLSQFFRSFLAVVAPELSRELALTGADLGSMSAAWFAAFAVTQFPVGYALDRFGPRRTVPLLMLAAAIGCVWFARAQSLTDCRVAMALIGVGCAPIYMGALYIFAREFPPARFALLSSWLIAFGSVGNLLGATPLAYAAQAFGWRAAFLVIAVLTLCALALLAALVRDPPRVAVSPGRGGFIGGIVETLSIPALWPLLPLVFLSYAVVISERALWIGPYFSDVHGLGPIERGNAVIVFALAQSVGAFMLGALDQPLGTRKWIVVAGSVITAICFAALALASGVGVTTAIILYAVIGLTGHTYAVLMAHGRSFLPDHLVGRGITFLNFLFIGGAGIVQFASGHVFEASRSSGIPSAFSQLHLLFAVLLILPTLIYLASKEVKR